MTPLQSKLSAVLLAVGAMLLKQYKVHGSIDPIELGEWIVTNWDLTFGFAIMGWQLFKRQHDISPAMLQKAVNDEAAGLPTPPLPPPG